MNQQKQHNRVVFGTIILIFGALALIDNLNIFNTREILEFWPTVFIVIGALKMSRSDTVSGHLIGGGFIAVGTLMTLQHLGIVYFSSRSLWPVVMIFAGLSIIFKDRLKAEMAPPAGDAEGSNNCCNLSAVMSGSKSQNSSQNFRGGELTAVMGSIELDLRNASIDGSATINVFAVWGGIEVKVPGDWTVMSQGIPILGGIEDRTVPPMDRSKTLFIQGYAIMGGVEIKN